MNIGNIGNIGNVGIAEINISSSLEGTLIAFEEKGGQPSIKVEGDIVSVLAGFMCLLETFATVSNETPTDFVNKLIEITK